MHARQRQDEEDERIVANRTAIRVPMFAMDAARAAADGAPAALRHAPGYVQYSDAQNRARLESYERRDAALRDAWKNPADSYAPAHHPPQPSGTETADALERSRAAYRDRIANAWRASTMATDTAPAGRRTIHVRDGVSLALQQTGD